MSVTYEFVSSGGNLTLDESQLVDHNPFLAHTGKGDLRATFQETRELDDYAQRQDRLNVKFNGTTKWTGYLVGASHDERNGLTTIRADGIAKRLEETRPDYESIGGPVSYTNIALHDAIRDYWGRTEFSNFTVTDQSTETVATDSQIQSASTNTKWSNITTIADTDPIVIQNDNLELAQTNFNRDGYDGATTSTGSFISRTEYEGSSPDTDSGDAMALDLDESVTYDFNIEHTIPASEVGVWLRQENAQNGTPHTEWYLNGNYLDALTGSSNFGRLSLSWDDMASGPFGTASSGYDGPDLTPADNPHTIEVVTDPDATNTESWTADIDLFVDLVESDIVSGSETVYDGGTEYTRGTDYEMDYPNGAVKALSGGSISDNQFLEIDYTFIPDGVTAIDYVSLADNRYSYTFDNTVTTINGDNYLDGPEYYPDSVGIELDDKTVQFNVDSATATTTWNDTSNNQAIALSNDDGSTYDSSSNTATHTVNFTNAGRIIQTKFTFSRYGTRTDATPLNGFNGQVVNDYTLTADLNDLVVIDSIDLSRNHFDNLQTLHNYGNFLWVIEHDNSTLGNLVVSSFQEFDETRSSPSEWDNPENKNAEVKAEFYFNSVYLEGAKDANGDRPTAEVSDSDAINNDGREIQAILRDLDITTEAGAGFRAQSILQTALSNNDLVGTVTSPPNMIDPGFAREVNFGNGLKYKTVEEVSLSQSNDELVATYDFTIREDFSEEISKLKRQARDLSDQV